METTALEQQILDLQRQLAEQKAALEQQGVAAHEMPSDREMVHEAVGEQIQQQIPAYTPAPAAPAKPAAPPSDDSPSYLDPQLQPYVQDLVNVAFTGGLDAAVAKLKQVNNDALTDAFHDAITDEFVQQLMESGKLQKVQE